MGVQWKYLWPVLVLAAALTLGLGAALRFLRPASLGERIGVAEGASLRQVVVERSDGGGHGSHESSEPALLAELSSLLADTRLRYDGLTDGGVPRLPRRLYRHGLFRPGRGGAHLRRGQPGVRLPGQPALFRLPGTGGGADGPPGAHLLLKPSRGRLLPFYSSTAVSLYEIYTIHISIEVSGKKRRAGEFPSPAAGLCPRVQFSGMVTASSSSRIQLGCQKHTPATCPASISG